MDNSYEQGIVHSSGVAENTFNQTSKNEILLKTINYCLNPNDCKGFIGFIVLMVFVSFE